jgi:folate-binding protein YgfZ
MLNQFRFGSGQFSVSLSSFILTGDDAEKFLQTQSTFDVLGLKDNEFHLISFLDPQGRVETYGWLTKANKVFHFFVPTPLVVRSLDRLNKFLVSEDVTISGPEEKKIYFALGPDLNVSEFTEWRGIIFDEKASLSFSRKNEVPLVQESDVEKWRALTGWPSFDGSDFSNEIINNLRLFDLSVSQSKGCYPGQETVSKIHTRRGAAYAPVLLESDVPVPSGELTKFEKKIGTSSGTHEWNGKFYSAVSLLRDFRVEKMKINFTIGGKEFEALVRYYPLLSGNNRDKALEIFYSASDDFKVSHLLEAEEKFRLAIKLDPSFGDAYEALGVMLGRQERFQEAIDIMKKLAEVDSSSVLAHTNMSLYLMKMGRIEEAEEQKSLATVKSFQSFGREAQDKEQKKILEEKKRAEWAQRESMFIQVLDIDPEDTLANYGLGSIAVEKGEWEKARAHLERVLAADPKYSVAYLALGKALKGLGQLEKAQTIWREGIKVAAAKGDLMPANQMQQELSS